ncbi:MAG TPA: formate/nitrite transporter family protein [Pseudolabrys sp.]|jgi:formate/nitrite transporter FocA (FNT family)|nr:formate/nitrite transporter family protein [Pseudolabrys sp.]
MSAQASFARKNHQKAARSDGRRRGISADEAKDVEELATPRTPVIYEVVRRLGEEEMARPFTSLWWSGVAAGLSISFSLLAQAILRTHLPDASWQPLLTSFGYCVGFIMAVLSRQQLFTESTITAVLPVAAEFTWRNIGRMARLWAIVLAANLAGTLFAALFCTYTPVLPAQIYDGMVTVSRDLLAFSWAEMLFRAVAAGFLMAAMVWLMPGAERAQFHVITLTTWLIAVGGFTHIVAGSMEGYLLILAGDWAWWQMVSQFMAPVLIGNIIGGTALFTLIAYAQVMNEI